MKKITFIFLMALASTAFAQHQNLNTLPEKQRNKILVEIANKAIERNSTGYLRPGAKPIIQDVGILTEEKRKNDKYLPCHEEYMGRYIYAVYYKGTEEEHNYSWYKKEFLVKVYILADIGKVTEIRYIDDADRWRGALERDSPEEVFHKRRYCTPAEREVAREEQRRKALIKTPEEEKALREERERFEEIQRRKDAQWDSIKAAHKARVLEMRKKQEEKAKKNENP